MFCDCPSNFSTQIPLNLLGPLFQHPHRVHVWSPSLLPSRFEINLCDLFVVFWRAAFFLTLILFRVRKANRNLQRLSTAVRLLTELIAKPSEAIVICAVSLNTVHDTIFSDRNAGQNYLCLWLKTGTLLFNKPPLGSFASIVREFEKRDRSVHRLISNSNKSTLFSEVEIEFA